MNRYKTAREKANLTQDQLAEMVKVSRSTIAMWETGGTNPTASKLPAVASALGCTVDELLRRET